jgi:hypothetical protein
MSRVLRRPMFRGGIANSDGVGITSGLNNTRQGYADGPTDEGVQPSFTQRIYDMFNPSTQTIVERLQANQQQSPAVEEGSVLQSIYDAINPSKETIVKRLQERQLAQREPIIKTQSYREEQRKVAKDIENKEKSGKPTGTIYSPEPIEEVVKRKELPTLSEDIDTYSKLLMDNAGPDKDEYTRQKYLTLAKFGLNLLKPTPAGVPSNLLSSVASAAEKPLEEYGNISMQESKEGRALKQLAAQLAFQKNMPGNMAKGIQDLMAVNPKMTVEEATSIVTTGKNLATIQKEQRAALDATRSRLELNPNLKGLAEKDPASLNLLAKLIEKGNIDDTQIKGDYGKYNKYVEDSYYTNVPNPTTGLKEVARYSKGKFYYRGEPGFFIKQTGI